MRVGSWALAILLGSVVMPGAGLANQTYTASGHTISFLDKGGNEWWVEVVIQGASASQVSGVDARDTNGLWVHLVHKSWGSWAASFHVEPGNLVTYRAMFPDATLIQSCAFTHPGGIEQCTTSPPPPP
ncbi:MAG: hypothetical protein WDA16_06985, partial [Candidatus Thermoplasmatota archaeon]